MATIYRDNTDKLTIGEAKRLIVGAMPTELAAQVFASFNDQGEIIPDSVTVRDPVETCIHAEFIDRDFLGLCQQQGITPRHKYRPLFTDYSGAPDQDAYYTVTHDELVRLANLYDARVEIGTAPTKTTSPPAPLSESEWVTLAQKRAHEFIKQQGDLDLYPSQINIGDKIAVEFRKAGIVGTDGKPLSGATIKRHALKGISSAKGKQLSTTITRGK